MAREEETVYVFDDIHLVQGAINDETYERVVRVVSDVFDSSKERFTDTMEELDRGFLDGKRLHVRVKVVLTERLPHGMRRIVRRVEEIPGDALAELV